MDSGNAPRKRARHIRIQCALGCAFVPSGGGTGVNAQTQLLINMAWGRGVNRNGGKPGDKNG